MERQDAQGLSEEREDGVTFQQPVLTSILSSDSSPSRRVRTRTACPPSSVSETKQPKRADHEVCPIVIHKEIKRGFRSFSLPMVCGVSFEQLPAWIWVLRLVEWSDIIITEPDEARLQVHPVVHARYANRWRIASKLGRDHPLAQEASVWWISGTLDFS